MNGRVDFNSIGKNTDPNEGIESALGKYKENTAGMSPQELIDYRPKGPDPKPFVLKSAATGGDSK